MTFISMGKRTSVDDDQFLNHGKSRRTRRRVIPGGGDGGDNGDCFDRLPDDVVIQILERLNLKDAAKTSILSRRFPGLWKLLIRYKKDLDFQGLTAQEPKSFEKFVNGVMRGRGRKGPSVDSLTIAISEPCESFKKKWLRFARAKCVKNLEIEFNFTAPRSSFPFHGWDKLTSLTLRFVQVRETQLEKWLKNGLFNLESLCLEQTRGLRNLEVSSQSLKRLELRKCSYFLGVTIDFAPNLEFYKRMDGSPWRSNMLHVNGEFAAPKLSHICLDAQFSRYQLSPLDDIAGLEKLELFVGEGVSYDCSPRFGNLKELKLTFVIRQWCCFFFVILSLLLPACPRLQKLTLCYKYNCSDNDRYESVKAELRARSRVLECLKVVEFSGWSGGEDEVQAANLVREIAPNLEKIIYTVDRI